MRAAFVVSSEKDWNPKTEKCFVSNDHLTFALLDCYNEDELTWNVVPYYGKYRIFACRKCRHPMISVQFKDMEPATVFDRIFKPDEICYCPLCEQLPEGPNVVRVRYSQFKDDMPREMLCPDK
jgi:hypothetical protein